MSLGDFFPDDLKKSFAERSIDIGNAILLLIPDFHITYRKMVILTAPSTSPVGWSGYVVINSEINENVNFSAYLKSQHIPIDCARHSFLEYDSFVDCSELREEKDDNIKSYITKDPETVLGNVQDDIIKEIHTKITLSRLIPGKIKKKYGFQ